MAEKTIAMEQQPLAIPIDPTIWGEHYAFWCQTAILLAAAILAGWAIRASRLVERKKAAAEALFASKRDDELTQSIRHVAALHDGDKKISTFAQKENFNSEDAKRIKYALNHYEYVSVAIGQGIYDEAIFKASSYTTVVKLYERTKPFIDEARKITGTGITYQEFECLACRWKVKPLKHKPIKTVQA